MRLRSALCAAIAAAGVFVSAEAPLGAAVVFSENFENATVGAVPNAPQAGAYPTSTVTDPESNVVAAGGSRPDAPAGGDNLLYVFARQRNYGTFSATGDATVRYELDARLESGTTAFSIGLTGNAGSVSLDSMPTTIWLQFLSSGAIQAYNATGGGWQTITGISQTPGVWQHYAIEYELGATEFTVTAGATSVTSTRFNGTTSATELNHVFANGGTDSTAAYVDNIVVTVTPVPEPASLGALALGPGLLLARRRRNGDAA